MPGDELELGFEAWARRILGLFDGPFVPVGCSMGGYLAFELWRQAPDRIAALALADTRATPDSPEQREARDDSIRVLGEAGREVFWDDLAPKIFAEDVDPVVERARTITLEQPVTGLVAAQETIRDRADSRPTLPTIDVPVLVLVGDEDRLTPPSDAEAMVAALPMRVFRALPGGTPRAARAGRRGRRRDPRLPAGCGALTGDELAALLQRDEVALLDVRSHEEYVGEDGYPCDPYQGHIPGAVHLDLNEIYAAGDRIGAARVTRDCRRASRRDLLPLGPAIGNRRCAAAGGGRRRRQLRGLVARVVAPGR